MQEKLVSQKSLSLLIAIVHKERADYYLDALEDFGVNLQIVVPGNGTATEGMYVEESGKKAVIFNIISEENIKPALQFLEDKFENLRGGKGVAYTIPLSRIMGVHLYNMLANNKARIF